MSQAAVLYEGAKYISTIKKEHEGVVDDIEAVNKEIQALNTEIEWVFFFFLSKGDDETPKLLSRR